MIKKIAHTEIFHANKIHELFQASYHIEAELLGVTDFPPLRRALPDYQNSNTQFFGYWKEDTLAGAVELDQLGNTLDICSLVVHPNFFRQGIANKMLQFLENYEDSETLIVETGWDNAPAIALYKRFGFQKAGEYISEGGIKKICFSKSKQKK